MSPTVSWSSVSDPCEGIILVMVGAKGCMESVAWPE